MKRSILPLVFIAIALVAASTSFADPPRAEPSMSVTMTCAESWNVSGSWVIVFKLTGDPTPFPHNATLTQTGSVVAGSGGYPATGPPYAYAWSITSGSVAGDAISLTVDYTLGAVGTTMHMTGTIASDGTMSGIWDDNLSGTRTGDWATMSGAAACGSVDKMPPVITGPLEIVADATTPAGVNVAFSVTASDDVDGPLPATCLPPSGSLFAIGDTLVECKASDSAGNTGTASFTVHVRGASEQLVDLMSDVSNLAPPATQQFKSGLNFILGRVQRALALDRKNAACSDLSTFIRLVQEAAMPPAPRLTPNQAQALIADARRIRLVIGC